MVYYAIKECKNDSKKTKNSSCGKINYFRFPKNQLWKEWMIFCENPKINLATSEWKYSIKSELNRLFIMIIIIIKKCFIQFIVRKVHTYRGKTWMQQQYPELMRCEPGLKDDAVPFKFLAFEFSKACIKLTSQDIIEIDSNKNSNSNYFL